MFDVIYSTEDRGCSPGVKAAGKPWLLPDRQSIAAAERAFLSLSIL